MESRSCAIRVVLPIVGVAAMLMATTNASAQTCRRPSLLTFSQPTASGAGARLFTSRSNIAGDLQFRSARAHSANYAQRPGLYGYSHYSAVAGIYPNHYGYYVRPYAYWTPHFGWLRHRFRRPH